MKNATRPTTGNTRAQGGWFLRLAMHRRWFHEALFRTPAVEHKPEPEIVSGKAAVDTREPLE